MQRVAHWSGNTPAPGRVPVIDARDAEGQFGSVCTVHPHQEAPTTTTLADTASAVTALSAGSAQAGSVQAGSAQAGAHVDVPTAAAEDLRGTAAFDATGDPAAMPSWDELVRQHADRVYRLAYRLSDNQHDAEDLTQETFIRVFRSVREKVSCAWYCAGAYGHYWASASSSE